ncbi:hypothetical protein ORG27_12335 [Stenotrophomonas lactitubi]|uniref:hypothetical protein n=1 Tax=Stenotrophomonas lactitubi TaxID=2045214 RepID=UPI0022497143|nr:hypothetical protein [Stenotrophomonas lactitubi]MCX2894365.1 hypothetical protein [Stenotrophomonas lactitubi]
MNIEQINTSTTAGTIRSLLCAIRGHAGIDSNGFCKKCRSEVSFLPRGWRKTTREQAVRSQPAGPAEVWLTFNEAGKLFATSDCRPGWRQPGISHVRYVRVDR